MPTTIVEFTAPTGLTLNADMVDPSDDSLVIDTAPAIEETNALGQYRIDHAGSETGVYLLVIKIVDATIGRQWIYIAADDTSVYRGVDSYLQAVLDRVFRGITSLAAWLAAMVGKTADATTLAEIQSQTAGATYDNTTDAQEAIRDRGDASWTTGAGGGGGGGGDISIVVGPVTGVIPSRGGDGLNATVYREEAVTIGPFVLLDGNLDPVDLTAYGSDLQIVIEHPRSRADLELIDYASLAISGADNPYSMPIFEGLNVIGGVRFESTDISIRNDAEEDLKVLRKNQEKALRELQKELKKAQKEGREIPVATSTDSAPIPISKVVRKPPEVIAKKKKKSGGSIAKTAGVFLLFAAVAAGVVFGAIHFLYEPPKPSTAFAVATQYFDEVSSRDAEGAAALAADTAREKTQALVRELGGGAAVRGVANVTISLGPQGSQVAKTEVRGRNEEILLFLTAELREEPSGNWRVTDVVWRRP